MKTKSIILLLSSTLAMAQQPIVSPESSAVSNGVGIPSTEGKDQYSVVDRGQHHRIWQQRVWQTNVVGKAVTRTNSYTELETGMHWRNSKGEWVESNPMISILPDGGAAATNVANQLYVPGSLYEDALQCRTSDGKTLTARPMGLSYFDGQTNVLVAELRNGSVGQLMNSGTEVIYTNICTDCRLDLLVTSKKSGYESDLVIREQLPDPATFGFADSSKVRVQWWTEFFDPPEPEKTLHQPSDGIVDELLSFGDTRMGNGKAFLLGVDRTNRIPVTKQWIALNNRHFLVEEIPFAQIAKQLALLPSRMAEIRQNTRRSNLLPTNEDSPISSRDISDYSMESGFRAPRLPFPRQLKRGKQQIQLANADFYHQPGFVLDYDLAATETNFTFKSDTTYFASGTVNLDGVTTFEGGTVIKYATNASLTIFRGGNELGAFSSGAPYLAVTLTAKDDNSIGTIVSGSTGTPTNRYANPALSLQYSTTLPLTNFHIAHAQLAVDITSDFYDFDFYDLQAIHCSKLFNTEFAGVNLYNALIYDVTDTCFDGAEYTLDLQQLTAHTCKNFANISDLPGDVWYRLQNCLLVGVTNWGNVTFTTNHTIATNDESVFQAVGAAAHYLATNSPYRNVGNTNLNTGLMANIRNKTTYPPTVLYNQTVTNDMVFFPQAQRDADEPDLGYHYDPLDYAIGHVWLKDATFTVLPGTAIGTFANNLGYYGFSLASGSILICEGGPTNLNRIARCNLVQEHATTNWNFVADSILGPYNSGSPTPRASFRFTDFSMAAQEAHIFEGNWDDIAIHFSDCLFHSGYITTTQPALNTTNCLFERTYVGLYANDYAFDLTFRNNLFFGGKLELQQDAGGNWIFRDNVFDQTTNVQNGVSIDHAYNGYTPGSTRLTPTNAHDVVTTIAWQAGPLGNYYQPTNSAFSNVGSTNADKVGLYWYTTRTDQLLETNSTVDIGLHYVALDTNGLLLDADGDWLPNYLEDTNGNGSYEAGDFSNWMEQDTDADHVIDQLFKVFITRPRNNSSLP